MSEGAQQWGDQIAVETINGIPYRMYTKRPRDVAGLLKHFAGWGARPHVVQGDNVVTFGQMYSAIQSRASEMLRLGVKPGDRVFVLGWNSPDWIGNFWACLRIGAVPVLANAWWSAGEIEAGMAALDPALTLADAHVAPKVPADRRCGPWAMDAADGSGTELPPLSTLDTDEEAVALIIFTSGTSGQPKAVVLSHRALLARLQMTLHVTRKLPHQIDRSAHDVSLITGPLFHVGGMQTLLRAAIVGDTLILPVGRYDPAQVLELMERHKIQRWNAVPTMVSRLLDHPDLARRDVSSLKSISIGGAPVHAELLQRIRESLPNVSPRIPTGYGLTENGGQATAAAGSESPDLMGSSGRPLSCVEVSFLEHAGLPDGEILLRAPTQMMGYYGTEESPIDQQGWLHTGDLGRLDEKGNLWITGRCKDMIIRGGENIAPAAVERALLSVPGVIEAAVIGVPHPDLGEEVMAVVVVDQGLTAQHLREQAGRALASFAVPTQWRLRSEPLPVNQSGKIDKVAIAAQIRAEIKSEAAGGANQA